MDVVLVGVALSDLGDQYGKSILTQFLRDVTFERLKNVDLSA